ncbi:MAG TPA: Fe-S cluster assembly protein SufD [Pyrinomonadaceae bacterium]|nr:Fe-S cluster assembly protein SufD [Pyrinomonadaceae bacterium]
MSTQIVKEENSYSLAHQELQNESGGVALWVKRLRDEAFESFTLNGFPTPEQEEWKYTNVAQIARAKFETVVGRDVASEITPEQIAPFVYEEAKSSRLVFINGVFNERLSSLEGLPRGVVAINLAEALAEGEQAALVREHLSRGAGFDGQPFTAFNTAFLSGGAFLFFPKGQTVETPVHLLFLSSSSDERLLSFPRVLIVAGRESSATVIESYASMGDGEYLTDAVIEVVLEEGARVRHYKVQNESEQSYHIARTVAELGRNSSYNSTAITLGAKLSRHDITVNFKREGAECWIDGLYIVEDGQHADTHSVIDHQLPHCTSRQLYKGILDGKSRAVFNGKVFVRHGAQGTDAIQTNRNLMLSDDARVDTKPQLEIFADDVKCAHGATVGQLDEEELFYLTSRGLHPDLARNLLTYGFAEEVIDKIKVDSIKAQLDEAVLNRLNARLEAL